MFHDITERKRIEEVLRQERDKAQEYFDVAGVMLVAIDANRKVSLINKRGCEILGYKEEEIVGQNWFEQNPISSFAWSTDRAFAHSF